MVDIKKIDATVIIPAYNEARNIQKVIKRVKKTGNYEIIVVDDGSSDGTAFLAKEERVKVLKQKKNYGKAAACLKGVKAAKKEKIIFIDGDLQLKPEEIPKFTSGLDTHDLVVGVRDMTSIPLKRRLANVVARKFISSIYGHGFNDVLCGFRGVKKKQMERMRLKTRDYEFEVEMLIAAVRNRLTIKEVPISVSYNTVKGMNLIDGIKVMLFILKNRKNK